MAGDRGGSHSKPAWKQVYRALEHKKSKSYCAKKELIEKFPEQIRDFANHYVKMQEQRHLCDYDPYHVVSEIELDLYFRLTTEVIYEFRQAADSDKRAFCALVLFQQR